MPSPVVIQVEQLSKEYRLGTINHGMLYRDLQSWWARVTGRPDPNARISDYTLPTRRQAVGPDGERFFALDDVSFEACQGETLGIIGRNGAGKSTLLKILSRITAPSKGVARAKGRIASLLEVGTGFHPELTGRENVFLNGAILGMSRAEIRRNFDAIVEFSQLARFIDTPVKRYSSGMYVRLAFAVAAHLDAEIMIIDEVLAVGDYEFQKRCLGKMRDVATDGRTVLFVSHNMSAVQNLCRRAMLLSDGKVVASGITAEVIETYVAQRGFDTVVSLRERTDRSGSGTVRFAEVRVVPGPDADTRLVQTGRPAVIQVWLENPEDKPVPNVDVAIGIDNLLGDRITVLTTQAVGATITMLPPGLSVVQFAVANLPLVEGRYYLTLFATAGHVIADWIQNGVVFDVEFGDFFGTGRSIPAGQGNMLVQYTVGAPRYATERSTFPQCGA